MPRSTGASSAMATVRVVAKAWTSSADAGTTSTPPGHTARTARRTSLGLELIARHELADVVRAAILVEPVRVGAVVDLLRLVVGEGARRILLDDLVELGLAGRRELPAHRPRREREELGLLGHAVELAAREPAGVPTVRGLGGVLAVLLGHIGEVGALVELGLRGRDLLQGIGEVRRHLARRRGEADEDVQEVDLVRRRGHRVR